MAKEVHVPLRNATDVGENGFHFLLFTLWNLWSFITNKRYFKDILQTNPCAPRFLRQQCTRNIEHISKSRKNVSVGFLVIFQFYKPRLSFPPVHVVTQKQSMRGKYRPQSRDTLGRKKEMQMYSENRWCLEEKVCLAARRKITGRGEKSSKRETAKGGGN